jgi:hypothetical protein
LHSPGVDLNVTPQHMCPLRPGGEKFDHMPITLCIPSTYLGLDTDYGNILDLGTLAQKHTWREKNA